MGIEPEIEEQFLGRAGDAAEVGVLRAGVAAIDRRGRLFWDFLNPDVDRFKRKRGSLYRIERLTPERVAALPLPGTQAPDVAADSESREAAAL